eukprot:jgi/Bigna1/144757/aug1.91_g19465
MAEPRRVLIFPQKPPDAKSIQPVFLRHPKYGSKVQYLRSKGVIFELQKVSTDTGSWFIDDSVEPDGSLYVATKVDPIFLILPHLIDARRAKKAKVSRGLKSICEVRDGWDDKVFRISDEKTMTWLKAKVERIKANTKHIRDEKLAIIYAVGLLSEYLPDSVFDDLLKSYNLTKNEVYPKKRKKAAWEQSSIVNGERGEDTATPAGGQHLATKMDAEALQKMRKKAREKKKKEEEKAEKLKKAAAGTKSLFSFFSKKARKG